MAILPSSDVAYLNEKGIAYEEVVEGTTRAVVIKNYGLPHARYDASSADILILLPAGYPDVPPDMFYLMPWVKLAPAGRYPKAADQPHLFAGRTWQRWSRHNYDWRPNVDGIWTMLKRIDNALAVAVAA